MCVDSYWHQQKILKEKTGKDDNTGIEDVFMDKICIVKRRIQSPTLLDHSFFCEEKSMDKTQELADPHSFVPERFAPDGNGKQHIYPFRGAVRDGDNIIRIQLTPDQCTVIQAKGALNCFIGKILGSIDVDFEGYEDGQIVFNLHLKHVERTDMLDSKNVCKMLQVSKSFLSRLVKAEQIRSYKMGRLRRFLLEDVLDYLSRSEVLQKARECTPNKKKKVLRQGLADSR